MNNDVELQLTREYNIQCCCLYYPVLKQHIQYDFERCDNDPVERFVDYFYIVCKLQCFILNHI